MPLHTEERLDSVTAAFTAAHLLAHCYTYLFSGDFKKVQKKKKKPFTFRYTMMKIKQPLAFLRRDIRRELCFDVV